MLEMGKPGVCALGRQLNRFGRGAWLRGSGLDVCVFFGTELLAGATLNLAQAGNVAALEVAIAVLEFPECSIGIPSVENVSLCSKLESWWGTRRLRYCVIPLWKPYMFSWRTKDEILVCLKYWLRQVRQEFAKLQWH